MGHEIIAKINFFSLKNDPEVSWVLFDAILSLEIYFSKGFGSPKSISKLRIGLL